MQFPSLPLLLSFPLTCMAAPQGKICPPGGCSPSPPTPQPAFTTTQIQNTIDSYITDITTVTTDLNQIPAALKIPDLLDRNIAITNLLVEIENTENDQIQYLNILRSTIFSDPTRVQGPDKVAANFHDTQLHGGLYGGSGGVKVEDSFLARLQRLKDDPTGGGVLEAVQIMGGDRNTLIIPSIFKLMDIAKAITDPGIQFPAIIPVPNA